MEAAIVLLWTDCGSGYRPAGTDCGSGYRPDMD